jgi:RNA recognition motif-containing protein
MMTDRRTGLSRGFGFIQMKADAEAGKTIVVLNGTDLNGNIGRNRGDCPILFEAEKARATGEYKKMRIGRASPRAGSSGTSFQIRDVGTGEVVPPRGG